ncbi:3-hydroxyisobutyryl-CoA hydrolase-like protein 1, mitochondrial isoform X1 [Lycium barbarum]|uniref:3-hydroxyisobutyryl-CoA hydrolase-like protein 1, mitochondrial isoform X1 n=1 Tax=Lycium barbarum TaxID=112863 RepID=UPI00293E94D5|nr:3-hydroxyisobutyryl-CoA hydrolase-like protein 1, mitochondrial isoform X1 [Lycium barbarum]
MQRLKSLFQLRPLVYRSRSLCTLSNVDVIVDPVLVEGKGCNRTVILNRPSVLNSLNYSTVSRLLQLYRRWEEDPDVGFVVLKGKGRAFCAGGDVINTYNMIKKGNIDECKELYQKIYSLAYIIGAYLKPQVALLNGITMGGGAAISIPGTFRIATEKTVFSNPETLIGFHPDAGASFYLSHLPGYLGEYLALTGDKLSGSEMMSCGLATHYSLTERLPLIEEQLGKLMTDDPSVIGSSLAKFGDVVHPDQMSVLQRIETLDRCFCHETVEEIIDSLESEAAKTADAWCISTLKRLREVSPLSLKVSLRSIREGRFQTLDQCIIREYRMTLQAFFGRITRDYCEGVRARMLDKDLSPKWDPPSLEHVTNDMVDEYFSPLTSFEPDLELPIQQREAFA